MKLESTHQPRRRCTLKSLKVCRSDSSDFWHYLYKPHLLPTHLLYQQCLSVLQKMLKRLDSRSSVHLFSMYFFHIDSLKRTMPLKMDGGNTTVYFWGPAYFQWLCPFQGGYKIQKPLNCCSPKCHRLSFWCNRASSAGSIWTTLQARFVGICTPNPPNKKKQRGASRIMHQKNQHILFALTYSITASV